MQPVDAPLRILEYYRNVYTAHCNLDVEDIVQRVSRYVFTREDLLDLAQAAATVRLRGNIKPAPDGLTSELVKGLQLEQINEILALAISDSTLRPASWSSVPVTALPKPRGTTIFENRLIANQATTHKLYLGALKNAIYRDIENSLDSRMGGIRRGDLPAAWIARVNVAISKSSEWGIPMVLGFLDISRAFATIDHGYLIKACYRLGIREAWLELTVHELRHTSLALYIRRAFVGDIPLHRGLIEGVPTSSLLLAIFLTIFWEFIKSQEAYKEHCMVYPADYGQEHTFMHVAGWVDDWTLASPSTQGLQVLLNLVSSGLEFLGMQVALHKFQWLAIGFSNPPNLLYWQGQSYRRASEVVSLWALISVEGI